MFFDLTQLECEFIKNESTYKSYFSVDEIAYLQKKYYPDAFNSKSVRLEKIEQVSLNKVRIEFSESDFFSLLFSNILYREPYKEETILEDKIIKYKSQEVCDTNVLSKKYFANNLAVSILIQDLKNNYLLVKRTNKLAIGASLLSVSVTGGVDIEDLNSNNPIQTAAKREVFEELGLELMDSEFFLKGIFIGPQKLQPIAICYAKLNQSFDEIKSLHGKDSKFEIDTHIFASNEELESFLSRNMTEASRFQIEMAGKTNFTSRTT